jgi:hypothetical protein
METCSGDMWTFDPHGESWFVAVEGEAAVFGEAHT